ncbi:MAG: hypothetical protein ABI377_13100 [Devosia sp.]|jgi:hypothetical protein
MTYATLMMHLGIGYSNTRVLAVAADLDARFDTELIGIAVCHPIEAIYGDGFMAGNSIELDREQMECRVKAAETPFREVISRRANPIDWRSPITFEPSTRLSCPRGRLGCRTRTRRRVGGLAETPRHRGRTHCINADGNDASTSDAIAGVKRAGLRCQRRWSQSAKGARRRHQRESALSITVRLGFALMAKRTFQREAVNLP